VRHRTFSAKVHRVHDLRITQLTSGNASVFYTQMNSDGRIDFGDYTPGLHDLGAEVAIFLPCVEYEAFVETDVPYRAHAKRHVATRQSALPLLSLCNLAPVSRKRQIVCIHDANVFNAPASYSFMFRNLYRTLLPLIAKRATAVTTVSRFSAKELSRTLGIPLDDIVIAPNGHEHALRWNPDNSQIFERISAARPYVLLLGSAAPHKNMTVIFKIAEALAHMGVDIVVTGAPSTIFAGAAPIKAANINVLGFVSDNDLAALLSRALCLVFPSFTEGFGLPIIEAMAWGCPVIASDRASMPEVCGNAALFASPEKPEDWLAKITTLSGSPQLRAELISLGKARIEAFSWDRSAREYVDLLNRSFS
jgi:glycosyltransferase involved in cell wall biosynthesis